uniref:Uncharacterized protein n=1 Tax=Chlamydomonas euryale TaxID=1486919 RepID=A0A7R9V414_9CHLO|mmetsp:Transcript_18176/g.54329  ORF Transcript_18176/g.54329 Transcript_18176/m.54329 type:complete len:128 (+) Transcript_18176:75-458(+)
MAAGAALGRAFVAAGGTLLVLGGSTVVLSSVSMAVTKAVVDRTKKKSMVSCAVCEGDKTQVCSVCEGERTLKYIPEKHVIPGSKVATTMCACTMCEGVGQQTCVNCLGEGSTYPDKFGWSKANGIIS